LEENGLFDVWRAQGPATTIQYNAFILDALADKSFEQDVISVEASVRNLFYHNFIRHDVTQLPAYLSSTLKLHDKRSLAEMRLQSEFLIIDRSFILLHPDESCPVCNLNKPDDNFHILSECPYSRIPLFKPPITIKNDERQEWLLGFLDSIPTEKLLTTTTAIRTSIRRSQFAQDAQIEATH